VEVEEEVGYAAAEKREKKAERLEGVAALKKEQPAWEPTAKPKAQAVALRMGEIRPMAELMV